MSSGNIFSPVPALLEKGLTTAWSALTRMQSALDSSPNEKRFVAPVEGPKNLDHAIADFVNRLSRVVRYSPADFSQIGQMPLEVWNAAKQSFRNAGEFDLTPLTLPARVALSAGALLAESMLRGVVVMEIVGPERVSKIVTDFFEMFTETGVFAHLEYGDVIERCENRLASHPDDHRARMEMARTMAKCGRYTDAARNYKQIPKDASQYADAQHEAGVCLFRAGRYVDAARTETEAMQADPSNVRAKLILFFASDKLGGYPPYVPEAFRMGIKAGFEKPTVRFEDIAVRIGMDKTSGGRGSAVFDYNNDGYLDVAIGAAFGGTTLYRNNGDGTFTDVSVESGIDLAVNVFSTLAADYNNDGLVDLYVTRQGWYSGDGQLFRNNGDGTFTDVTEQAGLAQSWGPAFSAAWVDYDNDGFLDLFIANNLSGIFDRKTPNRLFHNNGDGTFTDVTETSGLTTMWPTICGAWGDYDNDGFMDVFLSNGLGYSNLFHNNGDGTFTDVTEQAGLGLIGFGGPSFFWDYDNDGWMDIGQYIWSDHDDVVYTLEHGEAPPNGHTMRAWHNNRDGTFTLVSKELGLNGCWGTMSGAFGDFNNDGHLDLVLGNGSPKMDRLEPAVLLEQDGKRFRNTTFSSGLPLTGKTHGANVADLFGDGRLSVMVIAGGAYPGDLLTSNIFCPTTLPGNYLNVRLVGTKSNRSAIGARVRRSRSSASTRCR